MEMMTIGAIDKEIAKADDLTKRVNNIVTRFSTLKEQLDEFERAVENLEGKLSILEQKTSDIT